MEKTKSVKNRQLFNLYLKDLITHSPFKFFLGCLLTIVNTFFSGISLLLLIPLLHFFGWSGGESSSGTNYLLLNHISKETAIIITLIIFLCLICVAAGIEYLNTTITNSFRKSFLFNLKKSFNYKIAHASWSYLVKNRVKNIEYMFSAGLSQISMLTMYSFQIISSLLVTVIYILFALVISPSLTLITLFLSAMIFVVTFKFNPIVQGQKSFQIGAKLHSAFSSFIGGIKLARSYNTIDDYLIHFDTLNEQSEDIQMELVRMQKITALFIRISSAVVMSIFFFIALVVLKVSLVSMIALLIVFSRLLPSLTTIQRTYFSILNVIPTYMEIKNLMIDLDKHKDLQNKAITIDLNESIKLNNVSFAYSKKTILDNLNCSLFANTTTAIVGHSGAGKSTLADLLLGILTPDSGQIEIDGTKLEANSMYGWRKLISYVPQETYLFNESIKENLLWASPSSSDEDIYEALKLAALYDFVHELPDGIDSMIGDRGVYLSGGQKQRLAIARALLRKPKVLLLDEATSALDMQNEELIYETLKGLKGHITIIIITHRLSTLRATDNILVVDKGKIIEEGSYRDLSNDLNSQFSKVFTLGSD